VVEKLTANHIAPDKVLAVVEQATTPLQHVHICNLYQYNEKLKGQRFVSPSLVIIGKVVELQQQFAWVPNSNSKDFYFTPMVSLLQTNNITDNAKTNVSRA
jgi:uroporphyrin-III C-methyltransferase/precorrin-2 dehydrogenase/sirohydrochlorin ferrochelatase/uroporphyrin-III C-methyltransferase